MYLLTSNGIKKIPKKKTFKALFCKHLDQVWGRVAVVAAWFVFPARIYIRFAEIAGRF